MPRPEPGAGDGDPLLIFGTGAQTKYVLETCAARGRPVAGVVGTFATEAERDASGWTGWAAAYGVPLIDAAEAARQAAAPGGARSYIACQSDIGRRRATAARAEALGLRPTPCVHPAATVAATATIGAGSIVNPGAVVQPFARLGEMCMVHSQAVIEHDAELGNGVNLAPGATLCGWVRVGEASLIYAGAVLIPKVRVGARCMVAAGAVVTRDVPDDGRVAGVPARPIG